MHHPRSPRHSPHAPHFPRSGVSTNASNQPLRKNINNTYCSKGSLLKLEITVHIRISFRSEIMSNNESPNNESPTEPTPASVENPGTPSAVTETIDSTARTPVTAPQATPPAPAPHAAQTAPAPAPANTISEAAAPATATKRIWQLRPLVAIGAGLGILATGLLCGGGIGAAVAHEREETRHHLSAFDGREESFDRNLNHQDAQRDEFSPRGRYQAPLESGSGADVPGQRPDQAPKVKSERTTPDQNQPQSTPSPATPNT